jgi:hypothetical protein
MELTNQGLWMFKQNEIDEWVRSGHAADKPKKEEK